jgi:antitoxin CptB
LENDLIITKFLDQYETQLTTADVAALTCLFDMGDNDLLDVLLGRKELEGVYNTPDIQRLVKQMREL